MTSDLKKQRGTAKAAVTKLMTQVESAINDEHVPIVEQKLQGLDAVLMKLVKFHDAYHKTLDNEDDRDESSGYIRSVLRDVQNQRHSALTWIKEQNQTEDNSKQELTPQSTEEAERSQTPSVQQLVQRA